MKQNQRMFNLIFGLAIVFFIFSMSLLYITINHYYFNQPRPTIEKKVNVEDDTFRDVIKHTPTLQTELKKYQLEKYTVAHCCYAPRKPRKGWRSPCSLLNQLDFPQIR